MRLQKAGKLSLLDVRSEGEFAYGHLAGSRNAPILNDEERHRVGLTYKQVGQEAAVRLGHELVDPERSLRVARWTALLREQAAPLVACWRGGLRSGLAQAWLKDAGVEAWRVEGGYKALRAEILAEIARPRGGIVISGNTGAGKTDFLSTISGALDLEKLADHRGSSFGGIFRAAQPAQQTFENALGQELREIHGTTVVEDESRLVGRCVIPDPFFHQMMRWPRLELECPREARIANLRREYVDQPLRQHGEAEVAARLTGALSALRNRLGGADTQEIAAALAAAFRGEASHEAWIARLLDRYYDPLYAHSTARRQGPFLLRGNADALREWLKSRV